jgi:hypothetical protein
MSGTAGYSGTPLAKKLGIKPGHDLALLAAPEGFAIDDLPEGVTSHDALQGPGELDVIVTFHTERAELEALTPALLQAIPPDGSVWVAWPKKASKVPTDITEDTVREVLLPTGMVDNKVCAIDATWSGLRVVLRKELRPGRTTAAG